MGKQCKTFSIKVSEDSLEWLKNQSQITSSISRYSFTGERQYITVRLTKHFDLGTRAFVPYLDCSDTSTIQGPLLELADLQGLFLMPACQWLGYLTALKEEYYVKSKT